MSELLRRIATWLATHGAAPELTKTDARWIDAEKEGTMMCEATMREEDHPTGAMRFVCARPASGHGHDHWWVDDTRPWGSEMSDEGDVAVSVDRARVVHF